MKVKFVVVNEKTGAVVRGFEDAAPALHWAGHMQFRFGGKFAMKMVDVK